MTTVENRQKVRGWRTLKEIYRHYLVNSERYDGKSAADVIEACFQQRRFENRCFERSAMAPPNQAVYDDRVKPLDALIEKTAADLKRMIGQEAQKGSWIALGRRNPDSEHELILPRYWHFSIWTSKIMQRYPRDCLSETCAAS